MGLYALAQVCGGLTAAIAAALTFGKSAALAVSPGYGLLSAGLCELVYTFMLCFLVLNVAAAKKNKARKSQMAVNIYNI